MHTQSHYTEFFKSTVMARTQRDYFIKPIVFHILAL